MDKWQTLQSFWAGFGWPAYDESSVPDDATLPYITYQASVSDFHGGTIGLSASLWDRSTSWAAISQKAEQIGQYISSGGVILPYDGGALWLKRAGAFAQRMSDPNDDMIRRIVLQIEADFISDN